MKKEFLNYWIGGFIAGEGCFGIYKNKNRKGNKNIIFALEVHIRDKEIIKLIQKTIGCGNIFIRSERKAIRFYIGGRQDITNLLIPFCDKYIIGSYKQKQYIIWRNKVNKYYSKLST